jgi:hypothetical protein
VTEGLEEDIDVVSVRVVSACVDSACVVGMGVVGSEFGLVGSVVEDGRIGSVVR